MNHPPKYDFLVTVTKTYEVRDCASAHDAEQIVLGGNAYAGTSDIQVEALKK